MKRFRKILVATDTRLSEHPIVAEAAEIAKHNNATLKIVDVVPDFSWSVRLTLPNHEHMRELIAQEKQEKLDQLAQTIRQAGVQVETKVLLGKTSVEIIREVLRGKYDLLLRVAKGRDSKRSEFFGNTGMRLLRECPCAVWLVSTTTTPKFKHVLGCVDTSTGEQLDGELNDHVYELAATISHYHGGEFSIVQAWSIWNEQMLKHRMQPGEFEQVEQTTQHQIEDSLKKFLANQGADIAADHVHLIKGEAPQVISRFATDHGVDLVVMGTVARSGVAGIVMGNTAEQILNRIQCSVLALKPATFVCPIKLDN
jgi:nucleotide-binding universal stress UspA family protein